MLFCIIHAIAKSTSLLLAASGVLCLGLGSYDSSVRKYDRQVLFPAKRAYETVVVQEDQLKELGFLRPSNAVRLYKEKEAILAAYEAAKEGTPEHGFYFPKDAAGFVLSLCGGFLMFEAAEAAIGARRANRKTSMREADDRDVF